MSPAKKPQHTILLVEDEESLLDVLKLVLESSGYRVLTAADGEEAVALYWQEHRNIALVLSDMGLPRMGGWDAMLKILAINPQAKVLLASGFFESKLREEVMAAGATDFIQKPYVPEIILQRIEEIINADSSSVANYDAS
ncbi:MAG: response regulator [Bacteroidetes bacterium]|nr:response regulator [Bacteroidota bacterium]